MPSNAARATLASADAALADAYASMAEHERNVFAPLRGTIERNHIADKIKAVLAT